MSLSQYKRPAISLLVSFLIAFFLCVYVTGFAIMGACKIHEIICPSGPSAPTVALVINLLVLGGLWYGFYKLIDRIWDRAK